MNRLRKVSIFIFIFGLVGQARAFDLIGGALNAAGDMISNVGGAAVHKVMDDSPEKLAAKRKAQAVKEDEDFQKTIAEINAQTDLSPLAKEHACISAKNIFYRARNVERAMQEQEDQRRAERDHVFTAGGMLGAIGHATVAGVSTATDPTNPMNMSNEALIARGRQISQSAQPYINAVSIHPGASVNVLSPTQIPPPSVNVGGTEIPVNASMWAQQLGLNISGTPDPKMAAGVVLQRENSKLTSGYVEKISQDNASVSPETTSEAGKSGAEYEPEFHDVNNTPSPFNIQSDRSRKIYVAFEGDPSFTASLQSILKQQQYQLTETLATAEVVYQLQGDFSAPGGPLYEGLSISASDLHEGKVQLPQTLQEKHDLRSNLARGIGFLMAAQKQGGASGVPVADLLAENQPHKVNGKMEFPQMAVVVLTRHDAHGDLRAASQVEALTPTLMGKPMVDLAIEDLLEKTGILPVAPGLKPAETHIDATSSNTTQPLVVPSAK